MTNDSRFQSKRLREHQVSRTQRSVFSSCKISDARLNKVYSSFLSRNIRPFCNNNDTTPQVWSLVWVWRVMSLLFEIARVFRNFHLINISLTSYKKKKKKKYRTLGNQKNCAQRIFDVSFHDPSVHESIIYEVVSKQRRGEEASVSQKDLMPCRRISVRSPRAA